MRTVSLENQKTHGIITTLKQANKKPDYILRKESGYLQSHVLGRKERLTRWVALCAQVVHNVKRVHPISSANMMLMY